MGIVNPGQLEVYDEIGKPELKKEWTEHYLEDSKPGRALIENDFEEAIKIRDKKGLNTIITATIMAFYYNAPSIVEYMIGSWRPFSLSALFE